MDLPQIRQYQPRLAQAKDIAGFIFVCPIEVSTLAIGLRRRALVLADALMKGEIKNGFAQEAAGHYAMRVVIVTAVFAILIMSR